MASESTPKCVSHCPYFAPVQGRCTHDLQQLLVTYLREHPDAVCPIYDDFRAEAMRTLARQLETH